jgi:hypothetical protein
VYTKLNVRIIKLKEKHRCKKNEYFLIQYVTSGAKRKTCKENNMMANTCSLDGRREAIKTDATTEAFTDIQLVNAGFLRTPGALTVDSV